MKSAFDTRALRHPGACCRSDYVQGARAKRPLNKALEGRQHVREYCRFTEPNESRVAVKRYKAASGGLAAWLAEHTVSSPDAAVPQSKLHRVYAEHCRRSLRPASKQMFGCRLPRPSRFNGRFGAVALGYTLESHWAAQNAIWRVESLSRSPLDNVVSSRNAALSISRTIQRSDAVCYSAKIAYWPVPFKKTV